MDRKGRLAALERMSDYLADRLEASLHDSIEKAVALLAVQEEEQGCPRDGQHQHPSEELDTPPSEYEVLRFLGAIAEKRRLPHVSAALACLMADCDVEVVAQASRRAAQPAGDAR